MDELKKILTADNVIESINNNLDYLTTIIPEIKYMINFDHKNIHHHLDVFEHTLLAISKSKNDFEIRLCLLLHDIGKPFSYQEDGEYRHYHNHQLVSANMAKNILERLDFDEKFIDEVYYLIRNHDYPISEENIKNNYDLMLKLYEIQRCDSLSHHPSELDKRNVYLTRCRKLLERGF